MSRKPQYNHTRVTLTPTVPPPKTWTTPTYHLERYNIRRNIKTVNVQLHGLRGSERRTESISFPLLPNVTDAELVRAAVFCSPHKWTVPFGMNGKQFHGQFASPLNEQLLAALMRTPNTSSPGAYQQTQFPPYAAPTIANVPISQPRYQSSIPMPGQFQQPFTPYSPSPTSSRRGLWQWYKTRTRRMKISLGCGSLIAVLLFFSCISAAVGSSNLASTPTPTPTAGQAAVIMSPAATQQPTPTSQPTPTPKPTIAPNHQPQPTQPPHTPTPCPGVNCNPWGYNFTPGNYITSPPSNFCSYFNCITSFWNGHGYVEECQDATYSLSGGIQGSCSHHGGNLRPLYSH